MTASEARVGSVIRARIPFPPAPAGSVGRIVGHYFLGTDIHAITVQWELPNHQELDPVIIPRDDLKGLELFGQKVA